MLRRKICVTSVKTNLCSICAKFVAQMLRRKICVTSVKTNLCSICAKFVTQCSILQFIHFQHRTLRLIIPKYNEINATRPVGATGVTAGNTYFLLQHYLS